MYNPKATAKSNAAIFLNDGSKPARMQKTL